jgi:nicotinamide riboside kinase
MKISILGAAGTGKAALADALARHFRLQACPAATIDIVNSSALTDAVCGELPRGDASLYDQAIAEQRRYDLTLLTGLDLPWTGDSQLALQRRQTDARLRAALQQADIAYSVVYGQGEQRMRNALRLIAPVEHPAALRAWVCEKCSDPDCELRLFTGLQGLKAAAHPRA